MLKKCIVFILCVFLTVGMLPVVAVAASDQLFESQSYGVEEGETYTYTFIPDKSGIYKVVVDGRSETANEIIGITDKNGYEPFNTKGGAEGRWQFVYPNAFFVLEKDVEYTYYHTARDTKDCAFNIYYHAPWILTESAETNYSHAWENNGVYENFSFTPSESGKYLIKCNDPDAISHVSIWHGVDSQDSYEGIPSQGLECHFEQGKTAYILVKFYPNDCSGSLSISCVSTDKTNNGNGESKDPQENGDMDIPDGYTGIFNVADLNAVRNELDGKYILMNDIDLSSVDNWFPIGGEYQEDGFSGVLDGNGHAILNMNMDADSVELDYVGLFSILNGATIKNIKAITGRIYSEDTAYLSAGAIAGLAYSSNISGCANYVEISYRWGEHTDEVYTTAVDICFDGGGIAGGIYEDTVITECCNYGSITGISRSAPIAIGGIVGVAGFPNAEITDCFNSASLSLKTGFSSAQIGGIIGSSLDNTIRRCYNAGLLHCEAGELDYIGSIAGEVNNSPSNSIVDCYYDATATVAVGCVPILKDRDAEIYINISAEALNTESMQMQSSFVGFDFSSIWRMGDNEYLFPVLQRIGDYLPDLKDNQNHGSNEENVGSDTPNLNLKKVFVCTSEREDGFWLQLLDVDGIAYILSIDALEVSAYDQVEETDNGAIYSCGKHSVEYTGEVVEHNLGAYYDLRKLMNLLNVRYDYVVENQTMLFSAATSFYEDLVEDCDEVLNSGFGLDYLDNPVGYWAGTLYNVMGGVRFDFFWGNYQIELREAAVANIMSADENGESLIHLMNKADSFAKKAMTIYKGIGLDKDGIKRFGTLLDSPATEYLEAYNKVSSGIGGFGFSDFLDIAELAYDAQRAYSTYAMAVEYGLLKNSYVDDHHLKKATENVYAYYEEETHIFADMFMDAVKTAGNNIAGETIKDVLKKGTGFNNSLVKLVKLFSDEVLNMKNMTAAVEQTHICSAIQKSAIKQYNNSEDVLTKKYCVILYLRACQYAYSLYEFDPDLSFSTKLWKNKTQQAIEKLVVYSDTELVRTVDNDKLDLTQEGFIVVNQVQS